MELFLSLAALCAFALLPAGAPVLLRCGLSACLRFSPRAALALSSCAAASAGCTILVCRGCLRALSTYRCMPVAIAALLGGTSGRMLLLMFTARFSGSLALGRIQAVPLVLLTLAAWLPRQMRLPDSKTGLFLLSLACAAIDGFFGCGGMALFLFAGRGYVHRKRFSPSCAALLLGFISQLSALLLTFFSGACEIFPARILLLFIAAPAIGGLIFEKTKKRSPFQSGLRTALCVYMIFAALAGIEQAFL